MIRSGELPWFVCPTVPCAVGIVLGVPVILKFDYVGILGGSSDCVEIFDGIKSCLLVPGVMPK